MITAPAINPGTLDRRLTLLAPLLTRTASGAAIASWVDSGAVWARKLPQGGREFIAAQGRHSELTAVFRARYRSDLAATWRMIVEGVLYIVVSAEEVGRREYIDIAARALNAGGETVESATVKAFTVDLTADTDTVAVTYSTAFASSPAGIWVKVITPAGGFVIEANVVDSTRTASGFTAQLGALVPASGYKLSVIAIQ